MRRTLAGGLAIAAVLGVAGAGSALAATHDDDHGVATEPGAREVRSAAVRLSVADAQLNRVSVVDLASRRVLARLRTAGPARLAPAGDGRHVLAGQSAANRVDVVDAGAWSVPHGDHDHSYVRAPRLRTAITGPTPIHLVGHGDRVAIFTDGDGVGLVQRHSAIGTGARGAVRVRTAAAHHGVAVPLGARTLISLPPSAEGGSPNGVGVANAKGRVVQRFRTCPGLHGEASVGHNTVVFACSDGYLAVNLRNRKVSAKKLPAVADGAGVRRSGTLSGAEGLPYVIGNLGSRDLVRVTPGGGPANVIPLDQDRGVFVLDGESRSVLAVTVDGNLVQLNPTTGAVIGRVQVAAPFSLSGGSAVPRPQIALGAERRVYVSDPTAGRVVEVATNPLRVTRSIAVGGTPTSLVVTGGHGEHDHDH